MHGYTIVISRLEVWLCLWGINYIWNKSSW